MTGPLGVGTRKVNGCHNGIGRTGRAEQHGVFAQCAACLLYTSPEMATAFDYLPENAIVIIEDTPRLRDAVRDFHARVADDVTALLERGEMPPALGEYAVSYTHLLLAARTVEVKPVEVNLVRTPVAVRLAAVEQRYFALMRLGGHTVCADAERTTVDVDQQVLVNAVSFDPVIAVADELTELRAVIQRAFRKFGRQ